MNKLNVAFVSIFGESSNFKTVSFHGQELQVPNRISFLAFDADGTIYGFADKPDLLDFAGVWENSNGEEPFYPVTTHEVAEESRSLWTVSLIEC